LYTRRGEKWEGRKEKEKYNGNPAVMAGFLVSGNWV
jgi:hypothetical protein